MPIEYAGDDEMAQAITDMIGDETYSEFDPIRQQETKILVAAMVKTDKDGVQEPTKGEPVIIRKVSAADKPFIDGHYKVYIDKTRWDEANELQQKAMLHRGLMRINIESKESGIKLGTRKPDVLTFQATIVRFGAWEEELIQLRNNLQAAQSKAKTTAAEPAKARKSVSATV